MAVIDVHSFGFTYPAANGRPFATSPSRSSLVRFSDFLQGTLNALAVSPLSPSGYLVMRTISLTGLAAAETIAIVWIGFGTIGAWVLIIGGTAALGVIYTGLA